MNILDYDYYFRLTDALHEGKIHEALIIFDEILEHGFDGHNFLVGMGSHFRNLLVCKDPVTMKLLEVGDNIKARYNEQSAKIGAKFLVDALTITGDCDVHYKTSKNQRLHVELALMKISSLTQLEGEKKK